MKLLTCIVLLLGVTQANAFFGTGCEEDSIKVEFKSLKEEANALRIEARSNEHYQMAIESLEFLGYYGYEVSKEASTTNINFKL